MTQTDRPSTRHCRGYAPVPVAGGPIERDGTPYLEIQTGSDKRFTPTDTRPLGFGRQEDIASPVVFLLPDQAGFIVEQTLKLAGGTDLQISMVYPREPLA
jgi:NAD(P)-dependent dehydrogenase (short-subunit alcohol dehydrogenase family)